MEETRQARTVTLFERALQLPAAQRMAFVEQACGSDAALRAELTSLLEANDSASGYFDAMAAEIISPAYTKIMRPGTSGDATLLPQLQAALADAYRIERELTGGAMSRVFLAEDVKLGRKVVIKVLPPGMSASVSAERFRREIQVAAQLQHPHIVPLLASDFAGSFLYYTMPYVAGESLHARLARADRLPVGEASGIWHDVLDALAHAHANGVVHRDIKPSNILLAGRNALVTDFGIARAIEAAAGDALLTETGLAIGTPTYMAPEQATGRSDADHRVDIYAAALVMYEMLEGDPPFQGSSVRELVMARLTTDPPPLQNPECAPELADLVLRCLATEPGARPESADAVLAELDSLPSLARTGGTDALHTAFTQRDRGPFPPRKKLRHALYGVAALAVAAAAFGLTQLRNGAGERALPGDVTQPSIAVLPLKNLSLDPGDAALADGMTEELIATLGKAGNLRVIASTSVFALEGRRMSVRQIAESLGVVYVLEGGFQKVGARVRMQLRLVDARDGAPRWSETYDREMGDILAVQDDISRAVARELDVRLAGGGRAVSSPRRRYTPNIEAYEWYLRGMDIALLRSDTGRRRGMEYFNRAIAIDSNFAAAYAGKVRMYLGDGASGSGTDQRERSGQAEQAAMKALALDDSLAEAHAALGWSRLGNNQFASAEASLLRALALDPNVPRGHEGLARTYMWLGRRAEQLTAARIGVEKDPFSHSAIREFALALSVNGRCDEAIERLRPLKRLSPPAAVAGVVSGICYGEKQMWPQAIAEFRWAMSNGASAALALLGYALARSGRADEASAILSDLQSGRKNSNGAFGIAVVYAGLRNYDQAFASLDKSVEEGSLRVYIMNPLFADLHRDPRFNRLLRSAGVQNR